jgi:regulator of replication initiation timing
MTDATGRSDEIDDPYLRKRDLAADFRASLHSRPDPNTYAWFKRHLEEIQTAYNGANHSINLAVANTRQNMESVRKAHDRMDATDAEMQALRADMGQMMAENAAVLAENKSLREEVEAMKRRLSDMSLWATDMNKWAKSQGKPPKEGP